MKIGLVHADYKSIIPMIETIKTLEPKAEIVNFTDENLLAEAIKSKHVNKKTMRDFARLVFRAADAGVDGILVCCSVFAAHVGLLDGLLEIPIVAVDSRMLNRAVEEGNYIGVIATNVTAGPTSLQKILSIAKSLDKVVDYELETVLDAAIELKNGNLESHNLMIFDAAQRLKLKGCDTIVLAQVTMANSAELVEKLGLLTLSSPVEGTKQILEEIEEKRQIKLYNRYEKEGCSCC